MAKKAHEQRDCFQNCGHKETTKNSPITWSPPCLGLKGQEREWLLETEGENLAKPTSLRGVKFPVEGHS